MQFDQLFVILRCNLKLFRRQAGSAESLVGDLRIGVQLEKMIGGSSNQIEIRILEAQQGQVRQAFHGRRTLFQQLAGYARSRLDIADRLERYRFTHQGAFIIGMLPKTLLKRGRGVPRAIEV